RLCQREDDRQEARRRHAEASDDRRADGVNLMVRSVASAARLEPWPRARSLPPSFETPPPAAPQDEVGGSGHFTPPLCVTAPVSACPTHCAYFASSPA